MDPSYQTPKGMNAVAELSPSKLSKQSVVNSTTSTKPFSFDTIADFDEHIDQSIPDYSQLAQAIVRISQWFTKPNTAVYDLGCSTGKLLEQIPHNGWKIGVDLSTNLLPKSHDLTDYIREDLRNLTFKHDTSLVMSIFTLQFIPPTDRLGILEKIYDSLVDGGAFIWAEKVRSETGYWEQIQSFAHYDYKANYFTAEEILAKERDLRRIMWPNTTAENIDLAEQAGFDLTRSEAIWKFHNFECVILVK